MGTPAGQESTFPHRVLLTGHAAVGNGEQGSEIYLFPVNYKQKHRHRWPKPYGDQGELVVTSMEGVAQEQESADYSPCAKPSPSKCYFCM